MLNKIFLKGNVGRTPEIKVTQEGKPFATFCIATNLTWQDATGEWQTHTDWHRIAVFREPSVRWIKDFLKSGDMVYVEGRLSYNSWTDKFHQTRFTPQVVVENWQGHIEHLRRSRNSDHGNAVDVQEEDYDQKDLLLMEESLVCLSPFPLKSLSEEEKPFFQGHSCHSPFPQEEHSRVKRSRVTHSPENPSGADHSRVHCFQEDVL